MTPQEVLRTEWSKEFEEGMKNRMVVSFFKYGPISKGFPHKIDAIGSLAQRLEKYAETGNTEYLMDAANFAMIEFMMPRHPHAYFEGTDDSGSPGRIEVRGGTVTRGTNDEAGPPRRRSPLADFR